MPPRAHPQADGVPQQFQALVESVVEAARADPRLVGVMVGGSVATGNSDHYSDLDLVIVCTEDGHEAVLAGAPDFAAGVGPLLAAFIGHHVGEPRLLIALYGPPPQHVDLKFVTVADLADRVEDGLILWQAGSILGDALEGSPASWPQPDPQWIEDRFWVWTHYVAAKIGRGELFEAVEGLTAMRNMTLAPLATLGRSAKPSGVRRLEALAPERIAAFAETVPKAEAASCWRALRATVRLYVQLRAAGPPVDPRLAAEAAVREYLDGAAPMNP